jgi:sugar lactone lactonase YvrE
MYRFVTSSRACGRGLVLLVWAVGLLILPSAAIASVGYNFSLSFGNFRYPEAVTIDQANHYVYVLGIGPLGPRVVEKFDTAGDPVNFTASGPNIRKNELSGTPNEVFELDSSGSAVELAVDNSTGPAKGDLYVTNSSHGTVDVFTPDGSFLGEVDTSIANPQAGGEPCGVAVDPSGNVYVGFYSGHVDRYSPVDGNPANDAFSGQLENVEHACQIAVNSMGDVYVARWHTGPLSEYEPSEFGMESPPGKLIDSTAYGMGVDPANDDVFVDETSQIAQFEASGGLVDLPFGVGVLGESAGVAVDASTGGVYVANGVSGKIDLFTIPVPAVPSVSDEFSENVTSESAEVRANVDPNLRDTHYYFRYGADTSYSSGVVPAEPGADIGAGFVGVAVHSQLVGLTPGVTYHYQVVATNDFGPSTYSRDQTFTTFTAAGQFVLPDNRAWEMVSPPEKNGGDIAGLFASEEDLGSGAPEQASPTGNLVTYAAIGSFEGAQGAPRGSQYLSERVADGWVTHNITPPFLARSYGNVGHGTPYKAFSLDLSNGLLINGDKKPVENPPPPTASGAPFGYQNFYRHGLPAGGYQALLTSTPGEEPEHFSMELEGATPNLKHVVFASDEALTTGAVDVGKPNLYKWSEGENRLQQVNILPHGESAPGATIGSGNFEGQAIFEEGSRQRVIWSYEGALYMSEDGVPTVQIDASKIGTGGGFGTFLAANDDGSLVFFRDGQRLTSDSTAHGVGSRNGLGEDLYVYDVHTRELTDITVDKNPTDTEGAAVEGILGTSADGAYVYFVGRGSLDGIAVTGENNLYVWHEGKTKFIGALLSADENTASAPRPGLASDWTSSIGKRTARVSTSGELAVFMSEARLTGYDNTDLLTGAPDEEVYLYDATGDHLSCISCNPSGARPIGPSAIVAGTHFETFLEGKSLYQPRVISENGRRVFFESKDSLVSQDTNGQWDVYEYENGHVYLISGGTSPEESSFMDASANGSDVFFVTRQQLVPQDTDGLVDLYDARENGGFPTAAAPAPPCGGESCKPPAASQPVFGQPSSVTIGQPENLSPPPHKAVVKKKKKKKKRKVKHARKATRARGRK